MVANIEDDTSLALARLWCEKKGTPWSVRDRLGTGGTAPVFEIDSPEGLRALKIYDESFSVGDKGEIELNRLEQQLTLRGHDCSSLVQVYEGGKFEERIYLLMSRAPGRELEKCLKDVPRSKIRQIVDQVARAAIFLQSKKLCHRDIKSANIFVSDDFSQATLLDISVIRNIHDPVGAGSDRDGRLPVLATARYSPPEYLFRLLEPGPKLWHALNIYQLGGLLHDLIMREPLFQEEYLKSSDNRYRFAWIIATAIPGIEADDVDQDLVFTARQALDKDWERRSALSLQDFLAESDIRQDRAFQYLGLSSAKMIADEGDTVSKKLGRLREVSSRLEESVLQFLRKNNVMAKHELKHGQNDSSKLLVYSWESQGEAISESKIINYQLTLHLLEQSGGYRFRMSAKLAIIEDGKGREVTMELPELPDNNSIEGGLIKQAESVFAKLAVAITKPNATAKEA